MRDDLELLELMLADERCQPPLYRPGPYWTGYQKRVASALRRFGLSNFRQRPEIGKGYADTIRKHPSEMWLEQGRLRFAVKSLLASLPLVRGMLADAQRIARINLDEARLFRDRFYQATLSEWLYRATAGTSMPETTAGGCEDLVTINGQRVAYIYLNLLMRMENFAHDVDFARSRSAMEIGGGFGGWMHLLISRYPNVRKVVYIDIPPMIYVGTQYLRQFFGDSVVDYRVTRARARLSFAENESLEIMCLCPWQIERLDATIDVFSNAASFREMPLAIVRNYARHVERVLTPITGAACLRLEDPSASTKEGMTGADEILAAFGGLSFEYAVPVIEEVSPRIYAVGRKLAGTT